MATLRCPCGTTINNRQILNEVEGVLLTGEDIDNMDLEWMEGRSAYYANEIGRGVWECNNCGRLAFNWPRRDGCEVKWYRPEDGQPGALMAFKQVAIAAELEAQLSEDLPEDDDDHDHPSLTVAERNPNF
jgi:hypothetical protein